VVIVGNLTLDDVVLPTGETRMGAVGGNSLYAALGARLWEPNVGLVTRRGEDFPPEHLATLNSLGISTDGVRDILGPTVRNWVVYEDDGRRTWIYRTPPGRSFDVAVQPDDLPERWLLAEPTPVFHIAATSLSAAEGLVSRLIERGRAPRITLDTHEDWDRGSFERVLALAARVHAFLPGGEELSALTGIDDPEAALAAVADLPTPIIVVKLGANGCIVRDRAEPTAPVRVGISPGPVVDVTGAGDAFCGGFAAGLAVGRAPVEAARLGAVSAGFAVADFTSIHLAGVTTRDAARRLVDAAPKVQPSPAPIGVSVERDIGAMRSDIDSIPRLLERSDGWPDVSAVATSLRERGIRHLVATGCGDSMFAAEAARLAFDLHSGVSFEPVHALELSRYRVRRLPEDTAVICVSYSGEVGRTIEAAVQARRFRHRVIALTGTPRGRLAREAHSTLMLSVPSSGLSPGTSTYVAMTATLMRLARALGGHGDRLDGVADAARETLRRSAEPARALAARLAGAPWICFVGGGPNEATARFGAAKLFEGPQIVGTATNLEEWAHEEYFVTAKGTPVVVVAPSGASFDRAEEIVDELAFLGADAVVVSDRQPRNGTTWLPLAAGITEESSPLIAALPLSLFAFHLAEARGKRSYNFPSAEAEQEHYETIHRVTFGEPA
jgi:sugar/nucleoside kinase (ribokinase family)/D-arabinose 5-phosphate isomerase GutQ